MAEELPDAIWDTLLKNGYMELVKRDSLEKGEGVGVFTIYSEKDARYYYMPKQSVLWDPLVGDVKYDHNECFLACVCIPIPTNPAAIGLCDAGVTSTVRSFPYSEVEGRVSHESRSNLGRKYR